MTQCKLTPQEFIQNAFSPVIATMCSPLVDQICRKNNLSFIELLQPFCKLNVEVQIRDPTGAAVPVKNLRITVSDVNARPPQPTLARKLLNASVVIANDIRMAPVADTSLEIPGAVPWYEQWRETFLQVQYPSDHEFTKHYLACIVVVASSEAQPQESVHMMLNHLTQLQSSTQSKLPKWFGANVLRYFVVLHDTIEGNIENAVKTVENLKQSYGASNCFLLQMNSRPAVLTDNQFLPDPWSQFLIRKTEGSDIPESDSPRTPVDSGGVTSMPNNVMTDTPILSRASTSPTMNRSMTGQKLEVGQEVNEAGTSPVQFHPLSPEIETPIIPMIEEELISVPMNNNVWQGTASTPTVVHGACLTTEDIEQLKLLIHEFCLRSLLPHVEKQIQQLSEVISNKKGVSRSLFSATKRWFSPNKPGQSGTTAAVAAVIYASDSPELQVRRLGDLYFMFGHYAMAFQVYHSAKRDFNADQAWLYYAGALEMAALSAFMCGEVTRKTCDYMEECIVTYLYTCRMPQFATRATLLSSECLKGKSQFGEAAHQFIRMTSEDSDLRSALLLEQAAYCFLHCSKPRMIRKYAFHIVLAGHRYSKCSQRKHSLRCYRQAFQVYNNKQWSLAEDHIYFSIGRQASNLKQLNEATDAFSKLLTPNSRQSAQQQTIFLKEYLNAFYQLTNEYERNITTLPLLPIPILESDLTTVLLGPQPPVTTPGRSPASGVTFTSDISDESFQKWNRLEEMMVHESVNAQPMIFKPLITLFGARNSGAKPVAVIGEPVQVSLAFSNSLQIVLPLTSVYLLWKFTGIDGVVVSNEGNVDADDKTGDLIRTYHLNNLNLAPDCKQFLTLSVTPLTVGELVVEGVGYTVVNTANTEGQFGVVGKQMFCIRGPKMKTKEKWVFGQDKRLEITVAPSAPCLQVGFSDIHQETLCNEIQNFTIELRNSGSTPLHKLMIGTSLPELFTFSTTNHLNKQLDDPDNSNNPTLRERELRKNHITHIVLPAHLNGRLEPGQSHVLNCWLRTPSLKGTACVDLLFYYENCDTNSIPKYRLVRHLWHFAIQESLESLIHTKQSNNCNNLETLTMSLQVTNSSQLHHAVISEITLLQAALLSPNWKLSQDVIIPRDAKLQSQETIHMLIKSYRSPNESGFNATEIELGRMVTPDLKQPYANFAYKRIYQDYNAFNAADLKRSDCLANIEALLVLHWHAIVIDSAGTKRDVFGQHYLSVTKLNTIVNMPKDPNLNFSLFNNELDQNFVLNQMVPPLVTLQRQVSYSLRHPAILNHDFTVSTICVVPVCLVLHSSADSDLIIKVNTLGTSSNVTFHVNKSDLYNPNASNHFRWMGHSEYNLKLAPFSSEKLLLNVALITPGTYDLGGRLEVLITPTNLQYEPILQSCRVQSALIVKNINTNHI